MDTRITSVALNASKPMFERLFNSIVERISLSYKTILQNNRDHFWNYLEQTYKRFSFIRPVGFGERLEFSKVYIPLCIESDNKKEEWSIDGYPVELISKCKPYNHLLIVDDAGMGKSTISKRMFIGAYENGQYGIPIFIELRHLTKENDIFCEMHKQIKNLSSDFDDKLLRVLIEKGGFIFFLDGYDEISLSEKNFVTESLRSFIDKACNNTFILTSRKDDSLSGFQTFSQFSIKQLNEDDAYRLLGNLDNRGAKSESLIKKLQEKELTGVREFLVNPLLVTLLFTAFDFEPTIPTKKHLFYDQVFNSFFQQHDFSKGDNFVHDKKSRLAKDDFERVLRCVGFMSVVNHKIEFSRAEIIQIIEKSKEKCRGLSFASSDYLDDLVSAVPLFAKEGVRYKWAHKSLAEYFAVEYIARDSMDNEKNYIEKLYSSDSLQNRNLFDLYFDIKPLGFRQFLLLPCLKDIKDELLTKKDDINKIVFCTKMIGRGLLISKTKDLHGKIEFEFPYMETTLPGYTIAKYKKNNSRSRMWWTVLDILVEKNYLFSIGKITLSNDMQFPKLSVFLEKVNSFHFHSENIKDFDSDTSYELLHLIRINKPLVLTQEMCKDEIKSIEKEIESKMDFSSWTIK